MSKKLKIGVNGRFFCQPFTGIGRYCLNIFPELAMHYPELEFVVAIPEKLPLEVDKNLRYLDNLKFEVIPENKFLKWIYAGLAKMNWEEKKLGKFFREANVDLIHLPYPAVYQNIEGVPVVVTVHDTIPWSDDRYAKRNFLSGIYNQATLQACRRANFIITVSGQSAEDILKFKGFSRDKLNVVYNASEFNEAPDIFIEERRRLFEKIGIDENDRFLFYMGGYDERKNVSRIVRIFLEEIAAKTDLKLVLGGNPVLKNNLFKAIDLGDSPYAKRVISTGFLENSDLIILYRQAWAYFSLTTREGFNLPLLEALTLGCPAIVSDLAVHREVAGDAPILVPLDWSDQEIAEVINTLQADASEYNDLKAKTKDFAAMAIKKYNWPKAAQQVGKIYLNLAK
jgi:glycosyltransferase involved in cell wall biosynthesis